jgi:mannose/fructose/N-acetylgalactosamine-specific phosphotransferase system component IID
VSVTVSTPGSYTVNGETDSTGSEVFSTSNSSVKYITVSKTGYKAETRTITTPASGNYNAVLQMSRIVVTTVPTGYIPPGGVTPVTTMDSRSTTEKDTDMMNMVRDAGPQLIQLAIVVTMISLLGLMTKGFGK